ncbi:MAG TPA: glycosyltransferase [Actinomycetes bacterium]|nr:glycosyltransferase [Actinomycetes bacterium]
MTRLLVTVGTDHHPFDRLVAWADQFAADHPDIDVLIQYGSAAAPRHAQGSQLLDHSQLQSEIAQADAVICHGGPATITEARRAGHLPICVPRDPNRGEHVDQHQLRFAQRLDDEGVVITVNSTDQLSDAVSTAFKRHRADTSAAADGEHQLPQGVRRVGEVVDQLVAGARKHPAHSAPADSDVTVLYIGGQGRSGSTLLERAIGQFDGLVSVGEVVHLWRRGLRGNETCGCGKPFHTCEFWSAVGDEAFGGWDKLDAEAAVELRYAVDRTRYVPLMMRPGLAPFYARRHAEYIDRLGSLYRAMSKVSGAKVIVDSSKHASYALLLAATPGIDLRLLHVVRDSRAVAHAWSRVVERPEAQGIPMPTYGPVKAAAMWDVQNAIMQGLGNRLPYRRVRYEDFVESPKDSLLDVLSFVSQDHDASTLGFLDGETVELAASHTVAGNPMRFTTGKVDIKQDVRWRTEMSPRSRAVVEVLTSPFRRHYGYNGHSNNVGGRGR